jgi:hypothetical protein
MRSRPSTCSWFQRSASSSCTDWRSCILIGANWSGQTSRQIPPPSGLLGRLPKPFPGKKRRSTCFAIVTPAMAPCFDAGSTPWLFATVLLRRDRRGRRICRARDRLDPARVHRSHNHHRQRASASDAQSIRALLQPGADTPVPRQRRSHSSAHPSAWAPIRDSASRRPSS